MVSLCQHRVQWSVPKGGVGVSTFYYNNSDGPHPELLKAFFEAIKTIIPSQVTITYPGNGNVMDVATGNTIGTWSATAPSASTMTGIAGYAGGAGAVVNWHTGIYTAGRELKGKTFLVPVVGGQYDADGTFIPAALTTMRTAADLLHGGTNPIWVYSKTNHTAAACNGSVIPDEVMTLKSRKQ